MDNRINKYAKLLVEVGLNVQKGQRLVINSPVECAEFARLCAKAAYDIGCKEVVVSWNDEFITREKYLRADASIFDEMPRWLEYMYEDYSAEGAAWLFIAAGDPELLTGVDPDRLSRWAKISGQKMRGFREREMTNAFPWCVASLPTAKWAKKVFPDKSADDAVNALWNLILESVRVTDKNDPLEAWKEHTARLDELKKTLTGYNFKTLKYKNSLGTDFTVGLPEKHFWDAGAGLTKHTKVPFCANMPTEEVFTLPLKHSANGVIFASMPLVLQGNVIKGIRFELQDGKIVKAAADEGEEFLLRELAIDEGASYLGELALVPYDSPISNQRILYYNTLFDENASCHIAFGEAYPCVEGGDDMSEEQREAAGINVSMTHVDFMIGTPDLCVTGTTHDGKDIPIFIDGNFAF